MLNIKKKTTLIALFSAALMVTSAFVVLPYVSAATTRYTTWLYVATSAQAQPVGVGNQMLLVSWTADMPPDIGEQSGAVSAPNGRAGWYGMQINVTDPDGVSTILDMPYSDPVGANYIGYTPEKVGTYQVQAIFPLTDKVQTVTAIDPFGDSTFAGDHYIYSAAVSPIATFEVVETAPPGWVESPLPNDYWTRPISGASREWYPLVGSWLGPSGDFSQSPANRWPLGSAGGGIDAYAWGSAPESAHILWTKPFYIGGLADERFNDSAFATAHYQGVQFSPNVILDGKISWSPYYTHAGSKGWEVIDLYTGETLYYNVSQSCPNQGSIYQYESPNQHGEFAYLWETGGGGFFFGGGTPVAIPQVVLLSRAKPNPSGNVFGAPIRIAPPYTVNTSQTPINTGTVWKMIDAHTLNTICYIANVSTSGTAVYGKDGSYLYYNIAGTPGPNPFAPASAPFRVTVWNSSAGTMVASHDGTGYWQWRPAGGDFGGADPYFGSGDFMNPIGTVYNIVHDGNLFYSANFSIPDVTGGSIRAIRQDDVMIVGSAGSNTKNGVTQGWMMGISLKPGSLGSQLWKTSFTPPFVDLDKNITAAAMFTGGFDLTGVYPEQGVFTFGEVKQLKMWVFDLNTGQQLWTTNDTYAAQNQYNYYGQSQIVVGDHLIEYGGYSGTMTAFDIKTGNVDWVHNFISVGTESPYGNYPIGISAVSGDKIFVQTWEHSYTIPLYRGPNLSCINATDGTIVWDDLSFGTGFGLADGIAVASNSMDNEIYAYGKGPSGTTVSAPQFVPTLGESVMLTGTVTDQTPTGRRDTNDKVVWTLQGTPAISDDSMSAWMDYKFQQQIYPTNATGVKVSLDTIDPNGNFVHIGDVTSDTSGKYGFKFTPEVPGTYQIIASFAGSKSYGPSSDKAYLSVGEPGAATPTATPPTASVADTYFVPAIVGLFVLVIVGFIVLALLMLRKRP